MFALYDRKAEGMLEPFLSNNLQTAMRDTQIKMDQAENLRTYAADFELRLVGSWDEQAGLEGCPPDLVINLQSLLRESDGQN